MMRTPMKTRMLTVALAGVIVTASAEPPTEPLAETPPSAWAEAVAGIPPVPPAEHEALFGGRMTRTMSLLATSHLTGRPVRIVFYGQSIVAQGWTDLVIGRLRERFPLATIETEKRAIGGYSVDLLVRTAQHDLWRARADLIVFHAYGGNDGQRERLIYTLRKETTAEILLFTHHADGRSLDGTGHIQDDSSANIRRLAQRYGCELAEVRGEWFRYLKTHPELGISDLLRDSVHLNRQGIALMAQLIERHFRQNTLFPSSWVQSVRWFDALRPFDARIQDEIRLEGEWIRGYRNISSSSREARLMLRFVGNRIDLVMPPSRGGARIFINGKPPSAYNLYHITRPTSATPAGGRAATIMRVYKGPDMLEESWTLTMTEIELNEARTRVVGYRYRLEGSVTGFDGEGSHEDEEFVSNSGRIRFRKADFNLNPGQAGADNLQPGLEITWQVVPTFLDEVEGGQAKPYAYHTVADGLPCGEYELTIQPQGGRLLNLTAIEIHCPPLGTGHASHLR